MAAPIDSGCFHPGAALYGNFINYYSFNPPEKRMNFLPRDLLNVISDPMRERDVKVLDIGCNAGDLTVALYKHLTEFQCGNRPKGNSMDESPSCDTSRTQMTTGTLNISRDLKTTCEFVHILGCDIDDALITRANEANPYPGNITFQTLDFMCNTSRNSVLTGFLSNDSEDVLSRQFDMVCCFSITMWIHLHHGDAGLCRFLKEASMVSRFLLVEPQPWKCYKSAIRRMKRVGVATDSWHFEELKMREKVDEEIKSYLMSECHMELVEVFGETHWNRKLLLFKNVQDVN